MTSTAHNVRSSSTFLPLTWQLKHLTQPLGPTLQPITSTQLGTLTWSALRRQTSRSTASRRRSKLPKRCPNTSTLMISTDLTMTEVGWDLLIFGLIPDSIPLRSLWTDCAIGKHGALVSMCARFCNAWRLIHPEVCAFVMLLVTQPCVLLAPLSSVELHASKIRWMRVVSTCSIYLFNTSFRLDLRDDAIEHTLPQSCHLEAVHYF